MIQGAGFGILMPNTNSWIVTLAPKHLRGRLIGNLSTAVYLGQFLSPVLIQPLINFKSANFSFGFAGIILFIIASGFLLFNYMQVKRKKL
jgi:MFS family permease